MGCASIIERRDKQTDSTTQKQERIRVIIRVASLKEMEMEMEMEIIFTIFSEMVEHYGGRGGRERGLLKLDTY